MITHFCPVWLTLTTLETLIFLQHSTVKQSHTHTYTAAALHKSLRSRVKHSLQSPPISKGVFSRALQWQMVEGYLKDTNRMRQQGKGAVWCPISNLYDGGVTPHAALFSINLQPDVPSVCTGQRRGGVINHPRCLVSWGRGGGRRRLLIQLDAQPELCPTRQNQSLFTLTSFWKARQRHAHTASSRR